MKTGIDHTPISNLSGPTGCNPILDTSKEVVNAAGKITDTNEIATIDIEKTNTNDGIALFTPI